MSLGFFFFKSLLQHGSVFCDGVLIYVVISKTEQKDRFWKTRLSSPRFQGGGVLLTKHSCLQFHVAQRLALNKCNEKHSLPN